MPTVAHIVELQVKSQPFLAEALRRGIINHAALAEQLLPEIRKELHKEVTFSAVNMAIRRLSERVAAMPIEHVIFDADSDITIRSHLTEITFFTSNDTQERIRKLYDVISLQQGDFLTITQGLHEVMLITNSKHAKIMLSLFPKSAVRKVIGELSSITVHISPKATQTTGMFYTVTRALAWEGINIVDIVSTYTELTFIIEEHSTGKAFDVLKRIIGKRA